MLSVGLVVGVFKLLAHLFEALSARSKAPESRGPSARSQTLAAFTVIGLLVVLVAVGTSRSSSADHQTSSYADARPSPAPTVSPGAQALQRASACLEREDWDCVESQLQAASSAGESTTTIAAQASVELEEQAEQLIKDARKSGRTERKRLLAEADASLARALRFDATNAKAKSALGTVRQIRRGSSKPKTIRAEAEPGSVASRSAADEAIAAASSATPGTTYSDSSAALHEATSSVEVPPRVEPSHSTYAPRCAENGSCYGDLSTTTGRAKTTHVKGYYRKDGTYVRGHYRSHR